LLSLLIVILSFATTVGTCVADFHILLHNKTSPIIFPIKPRQSSFTRVVIIIIIIIKEDATGSTSLLELTAAKRHKTTQDRPPNANGGSKSKGARYSTDRSANKLIERTF
jgi:hypothetical protein